jgi:hypothetical protein
MNSDTFWITHTYAAPDTYTITADAMLSGDKRTAALKRIIAGTAPMLTARGRTEPLVETGVLCTLSIQQSGFGPVSLQWYKDSLPLQGRTSAALILGPAAPDVAGAYYCEGSNQWGANASPLFIVRVTSANKAPRWLTDTVRIHCDEGETVRISLRDSCADPDGDSLRFALSTEFEWATLDSDVFTLLPGYLDSGAYQDSITVSDGIRTSTVPLMLFIHNVNRPPAVLDSFPLPSYSIQESEQLRFDIRAIDPDNDPVTISIAQTNLPRGEQIILNDSTLIWQSGSDDEGLYSITVSASDGVDSVLIAVEAAVGNVNRAPRIGIEDYHSGDTIPVNEGDTVILAVTATDPDQQKIEPSAHNLPWAEPSSGAGNFDALTGRLAFSPSYAVSNRDVDSVLDAIVLSVSDSGAPVLSDSFLIHFEVLNVNRPPAAEAGSFHVAEDSSLTILAQASDPDNDSLTWHLTDSPRYGALTGELPLLSYRPPIDFNGMDSLSFKVSDGAAWSEKSIIRIAVGATNDRPKAQDTLIVLAEDDQISCILPVSDAENDYLT